MKKWLIASVTLVVALTITGVAFGQQGTSTPSTSGTATGAGTPSSGGSVQQFHADLKPLNNSGVTGTAAFSVVNGQLGAQIQAQGLEPGQVHPQHIHQMPSGDATCPTGSTSGASSSSGTSTSGSSSATSTSGTPSASGTSSGGSVLTETQGESSFGPPILPLTQAAFPVAAGNEQILYANTFNANVSSSSGTPSASGTSTSGTPSSSGTSSSGGTATTPSAGATSSGGSSALTPSSGASSPGTASTPSSSRTITLQNDVVVLHGMTVNGVYDPTIPVACGEIQQGAASGALATPIAGQTSTSGATTPSASGTSSASGTRTPASSGTSASGTKTPSTSGTSASGTSSSGG